MCIELDNININSTNYDGFNVIFHKAHYDYVCSEVSKGIASVSLECEKPVMFGVLTTNNIEQAIERAGTKAGNKGYECAVSAIEMANLMNVLK